MKSLFIQSFKELDRKFALVILADILFYAAVIFAGVLALKIAATGVSAFYQIPADMLDITKISDISQFDTGLEQASELLGTFKSRITISLAGFWLLLVIAFAVFKGIAWSFVTKQKLSKKYFTQFFKLTLCWLAGTAAMLLFIFWIAKPGATGFLLLLIISIASYIVPISYAVFKPSRSVKDAFKQAWHAGVERIYYFMLPTIAASIMILLLLGVLAMIGLFIPQTATAVLTLLAIITWQSWLKYYIYAVARGIK